jgi:protocatechuate 4,5-dioxygenase beta chain
MAFYASTGLSHFTGGDPYEHYNGPFTLGSISEELDRFVVGKMAGGKGSDTAKLTKQDIIGNGEVDLRSWITMLGAIGDSKPDMLVYEPFYRGVMGMAVGYWELQGARE